MSPPEEDVNRVAETIDLLQAHAFRVAGAGRPLPAIAGQHGGASIASFIQMDLQRFCSLSRHRSAMASYAPAVDNGIKEIDKRRIPGILACRRYLVTLNTPR